MKINVAKKNSVVILEILGHNGEPANAQNPIEGSDLASVEFPEVSGQLAIVSGMPMFASNAVSLHYKNLFSAIAIANPRDGVAIVVHSISKDYQLGGSIPLA